MSPEIRESERRQAEAAPVDSRWRRWMFLGAGALALALGVLGIFLPLLPTTPLVLVAGFCFARGSKRAHTWLLQHRVFGSIVREWQTHRRIPKRAKWTAVALVILVFTFSMVVVPNCVYGYVTLAVMGTALVVFLVRLPTSPLPPEIS